MTDCIDRQAAINAICKAGCGGRYCGISCNEVKAIERLPLVESKFVKHGKWENGKCSVCGAEAPYTGDGSWAETAYCPSCGSQMDLENNEAKHGRWIKDNNQTRCSICGSLMPIRRVVHDGEVMWEDNSPINYCPGCGAKMEKGV